MTRKSFWESMVPKEEIVRYTKARSERKQVTQVVKQKELSHPEKMKKLVRTTINKKHENGRIYSIGSDGEYSSHSVSPYSKTFIDNIEEKIQSLVTTLVKRGYLTVSSCQGHSLGEGRQIHICFKSKKEIERFISEIKTATTKHMFFDVHKAEEFFNIQVDFENNGKINIKKAKIESNHDGLTSYMKAMFWQHSDSWYVLGMFLIGDLNLKKASLWQVIKRWVYKKFLLEKDTQKLANHINQNTAPYDFYDY